ncbi:thiamine pyrophosphate-binding protein [Shimia sp.]|uniref:thiamine pyrophosphate-binding protein n=1 Tax=Shimia sp. TaxID=1954381 RepID=UPI003297A16D
MAGIEDVSRTVGAQISLMLKARGVDVIFGIPGVHNVEMYRGLEEAGITHVLARHEQGVGFMADGYARASGKPGVAYVITGPGLCNIMTPMGQAYSDSVPVLVISSCLDDTVSKRGQLHQMRDQRGAAATVCDWSEEARSPEAVFDLIDRALVEFDVRRARPKHIQVPISLLGEKTEVAPEAIPGFDGRSGGILRAGCQQAMAEDILAARKPLFIFGGGLATQKKPASGEPKNEVCVRDVLRRSGAAAFTTYAGGGLLAVDDPFSFGCYLGRPESERIIAESDLVIAIGTELSECDLWRDALGHSGTLVRVDIDPEMLADRHRADVCIHADGLDFVQELLEHLPQDAPPKWETAIIRAQKAGFRAEVDAARPGIVPICDALKGVMPDDAMVFSDMTQFAYVAKEVWDMQQSGHWHHPSGFGTLGYALPAAIGGAMARRDAPTVCIAGDYGFQYSVQELGVAVEMKLAIPILLWDNGKLKEIEDSMVASQIAPNAVEALNPDFCKLAEAYGCLSEQPATVGALKEVLLAAFEADRPTVIRLTPDMAVYRTK